MLPSYNPCLEIKPSSITNGGRGLYSRVHIPAGGFIDVYSGKALSDKDLVIYEKGLSQEELIRNRIYILFDLKHKLNIIPSENDCYAQFANDVSLQGRVCNAEFADFNYLNKMKMKTNFMKHFSSSGGFPGSSQSGLSRDSLPANFVSSTMCIRAVFDIKPGDEIFLDYGSDYWTDSFGKSVKKKYHKARVTYQMVLTKLRKRLNNKRSRLSKVQKGICAWPAPQQKLRRNEKPKYVIAKWSPSCRQTLAQQEGGVLEWDDKLKRGLILSDTHEHVPRARPCFPKNPLPSL